VAAPMTDEQPRADPGMHVQAVPYGSAVAGKGVRNRQALVTAHIPSSFTAHEVRHDWFQP
jgi:hypothetical protein